MYPHDEVPSQAEWPRSTPDKYFGATRRRLRTGLRTALTIEGLALPPFKLSTGAQARCSRFVWTVAISIGS